MQKVAITGSTGLIGSRTVQLLNNQFEFIPLSTSDGFDITNVDSVNQRLTNLDFDLLLHLAAYTSVDGAEKDKELAYAINVSGTKNVFEATNRMKKKFIYISTDFVFDGKNPPYYEDSTPNPILHYGLTKYEGEKLLNGQAMIIRLSYPYGYSFARKQDLVGSIKTALDQKKTLYMMKDALITPTFIDDIVYCFAHLMKNYENKTYHIVGSASLSPYEIGKKIAKRYSLNGNQIKPTTYNEYLRNKAKRPQFSEIKSKNNDFYSMKSFDNGLDIIS